ncbi:MAG: D-2-hydroxyacid dehydrogenase [Lachnospiraceae bacterium]|nr:D-2-hydroxyacid dehydrogenase [Lachnospiraceae bacterium]
MSQNNINKILVVLPVENRHKELLRSCAEGAQMEFIPAKDLTKQLVQDADIIIGNVSPELLRGTGRLKWLQLNSAGTDGYTEDGILPEGALLTNATGAYGLAISEHMIGALLCIMKKLHLYGADQQKHVWGDHGNVTSIYGSKTLVVGFGDIGSEFAVRMNALGSRVTGIRRNQTEKPDYLEALYQMDALAECLRTADIVAACLPGTEETYHIFDRNAFAKMKKGAYFLNVGRGNAVDSYALAEALNSGHLAGASVDVTEPEPLPKEHPLWDAKNLLITPHISGNYHLQETHERIIQIAADNLARFMQGRELRNIVDFATGYRKL